MKIAYLSTFYPFRGGIAQYNAALYRELEKHHQVKAFTFTRQYPQILFPGKTQYVTEKDTADPVNSEAILDTVNPISYLTAAKKIQKYNPDLLVVKFWLPFFGPALGTVAKHLDCKCIAILDNVIPHESRIGDRPFTNYFLKHFDGFVAMSGQVQRDLKSLKPGAKSVFHLHPLYDHFPPPVDKQKAREKLNIHQEKRVLLYFGFIRDYKGLDLLIEAMNKLDNDYFLVIAGEPYGSYEPYIKLIEKFGVDDRIGQYVRYIDDDEVPLFYSASDVSMLTYKHATQSGVVSISYYYDLPVIVTDVGGLKETVAPYNSGVVVDKPTVDDIVTGIKRFFEKPREEYISGIANVKEKSSWRSLANTVTALSETL